MEISASTSILDLHRFEFGKNWLAFARDIDTEQVLESERALRESLGCASLSGKTFLDIGCGSGLSSLAACRLGARVYSFDYDEASVRCCMSLRTRFFGHDSNWKVERGSILDESYLRSLGTFDVVYSWGVLHHTGRMWKALDNAAALVKPGGTLLVAIYNDQGARTSLWRIVKRTYNRLPPRLRFLVLWPALLRIWGPTMLRDAARGNPLRTWKSHKSRRGMSAWRDVVDWVGGYPYEAAKAADLVDFYDQRGFEVRRISLDRGLGCNELVFERRA